MNVLKHLNEFKQLLDSYQISKAGQDILDETKLVLLTAISSTGRNAIIRKLMARGEYYFIVSDTTRHPRVNDGVPEKNGVEYFFQTEEQVLKDLREGAFLEAAVIHNQQVSGISMREIKKAHDEKKIAITDIEITGATNILDVNPQTITIFLLPPSYEEWLRRIHLRGEMSSQELRNRMESAQKELKRGLADSRLSFVINDDIDVATQQIDDLAHGKAVPQSDIMRKIAQELLDRINKELA